MADYEDSSYHSTSEAEADSEAEGEVASDPDDPQKLLNTWLGELDNLTVGLDNVSSSRPQSSSCSEQMYPNPPRIDSYRFSMANLEDSQDVELDAILGELCALGSQFEQEINLKWSGSTIVPSVTDGGHQPMSSSSLSAQHQRTHSRSSSGGQRVKFDPNSLNIEVEGMTKSDSGVRTESPDNDSAFSDNVSMLSSESSASSGGSGGRGEAPKGSGAPPFLSANSQFAVDVSARLCELLHQINEMPFADQAARLKAEKIRIALEKIKEANVKKLFIKAFMTDNSTKSLLVDEKMSVLYVTRLLSDKNHVRMDPKWGLVEHLPELYMERIYEDHENLVDNLLMWTRDSKNKILFLERPDKCDLFVHPERYLLSGSSSERDRDLEDDARATLLEEFFSSGGVPEVEGPLFLKAEGKKVWKKYHFVLRASGLYYWPKGKSKSARDLVCLATFEVNQVYYGINWRKKYKAPADFCFAIKHPQLQAKSSKYIKYLCAEDDMTLAQWVMGIRIAKHGRLLMDNYRGMMDDLAQEDIDQLASARSFSVNSVAAPRTTIGVQVPTPEGEPQAIAGMGKLDTIRSRGSSSGSASGSSGCLSERSSTSTPTFEHVFESDFPTGTIKRKPSVTPKIPLTTTTRLLVKEVEDAVDGEVDASGNIGRNAAVRQSFRRSLTDDLNTIRRKSAELAGTLKKGQSVKVQNGPSKAESALDLDSLPPPPPEFTSDDPDPECLPPPPPEFFDPMTASCTSINSLPPPPSPEPQMVCNNRPQSPLPPPPPPHAHHEPPPQQPMPPPVPPHQTQYTPQYGVHQPPKVLPKPPKNDYAYSSAQPPIYSQVRKTSLPPDYPQSSLPPPPPPPHQSIPPQSSPHQSSPHHLPPLPPIPPPKKISFAEDVPYPHGTPISPTLQMRPIKPLPPSPPRRNDSTKLSTAPGIAPAPPTSPKKLTAPNCTVTPPREFLKDLQRVMQKKWQVAQKCQMDHSTTPHEVLGFRDPPPAQADYRESNVRAWVQEHYGTCNYYENLADLRNGSGPFPPPPPPHKHCPSQPTVPVKRRAPPPPPPKRSETTQLSARPQ